MKIERPVAVTLDSVAFVVWTTQRMEKAMLKEKEEQTGAGKWVRWLHLLGLASVFEKIKCRRENTECSLSICFLLNCMYLTVYFQSHLKQNHI